MMILDARQTIRCASLGSLAVITACSTMPEQTRPPHLDRAFVARYVVSDEGTLQLPVTDRALVVRALEVQPAPDSEDFSARRRALRYPPGTAVQVRGRVRIYPRADGTSPTLAELFPGAALAR